MNVSAIAKTTVIPQGPQADRSFRADLFANGATGRRSRPGRAVGPPTVSAETLKFPFRFNVIKVP